MSDSLSAFKRPYKTKQSLSGEATPTRHTLTSDKGISSTTYFPSQTSKDTRTSSNAAEKQITSRGTRSNGRHMSPEASSSSSDYSDDSDEGELHKDVSGVQQGGTPRLRTLSKAGPDNRRIAIVQMDSGSVDAHKHSDSSSTNALRARRGHKSNLSGLALVAPPDAAPKSYSELTPPSTAPITSASPDNSQLSSAQQEIRHHRSASDMPGGSTVPKSSSRDNTTGSVGTTHHGSRTANPNLVSENGKTKHLAALSDNAQQRHLEVDDVFGSRTRSNRTPSPARSTSSQRTGYGSAGLVSPHTPYTGSSITSASTVDYPMISTPAIGQGKELHVPVAGPIVVNLESAQSHRAPSTTTSSWRSASPTPSHGSGSAVGSTRSYTPSATSSYLHYEPGLHATAGPLPPPPRATFNIPVSNPPPRPPRLHSPVPPNSRTRGDIEAVKQALQLPPFVAATLASRASSSSLSSARASSKAPEEDKTPTKKMVDSDTVEADIKRQVSHRREAATSESDAVSLPRTSTSRTVSPAPPADPTPEPQEAPKDEQAETKESVVEEPPIVTVVEPPSRSQTLPTEEEKEERDKVDVAKFDQWLQDNPHITAQLGDNGDRSSSLEKSRRDSRERPLSPISPEITGEAPSPPPKSFRNSLSFNMKRFSALPRTPSLSSRSGGRRSSESARFSSRTPSPSHLMSPTTPSFAPRSSTRKVRSTNPSALFCHEVHSQTTTLQRCFIYAGKINELYNHDCGLSEWVVEMKTKGPNTQTQRGPSSHPFTPKPRLTSRSSMASEATFPTRPDATVATDLSQGAYRDITPPGLPPTLPYPSLALNPPQPRNQPSRSSSSAGSGTPPSSVRSLAPTPSTKGAGFFASLGRKASMSGNRPKFVPTISAPVSGPTRSGSTNSSMTVSSARTSGSSATVPSGPRAAPPHRAQRSQTFMASMSSPTHSANQDVFGRRPSLFNLTLDTVPDTNTTVDPEFAMQVDKLHALLPHANRQILAGYLRRAGQDMLAIGQYLEDERMGTIRQF